MKNSKIIKNIALFLIIIPWGYWIANLFFELFPSFIYINFGKIEMLDIIRFLMVIIPMFIGYFLYIKKIGEEDLKLRINIKISLAFATIGLIYFIIYSFVHLETDYIGQALSRTLIYALCFSIARLTALITLIIDNKEFIKKNIVLIIIICIILIGLFYLINTIESKKLINNRNTIIPEHYTNINSNTLSPEEKEIYKTQKYNI